MLFYEKIPMNIPCFPFYFMRHGETDWNRSNLIMGQTDIPLNETGIGQAHEAKKMLTKIEVEKIYSSPLQRARQTAEIINEDIRCPIVYMDYLKERGWGKGEGQFHETISDFKGIELSVATPPEGAEHYNIFEDRVVLAFNKILAQPSKLPLIVGHGGIFWILTKLLAESSFPLENCALYFFKPPEYPGHPWLIVNLNDR